MGIAHEKNSNMNLVLLSGILEPLLHFQHFYSDISIYDKVQYLQESFSDSSQVNYQFCYEAIFSYPQIASYKQILLTFGE